MRHPQQAWKQHCEIRGSLLGLSDTQLVQDYEDNIKRFPDFEPAYNNLAVLRAFKHDYAGAEVLLNRALQLHPTYVIAWRNLAEQTHFHRAAQISVPQFADYRAHSPSAEMVARSDRSATGRFHHGYLEDSSY